jgi:uncharacterized repeat protein (TIGR01451 family)
VEGREHTPLDSEGQLVAFESDSSNIVSPDEPAGFFPDEDIFVRDRLAGVTYRVSESSAGEEGNARSLGGTISADGLVTAFSSDASNLVPNDTNFVTDIFVHDDRPAADLSVTKTDSADPVSRGSTLTYTIVVTNQGLETATDVLLTDVLSKDLRFVSVTSAAGSCSQSDGTVTCSLGDIPSGGSVTVTIDVTARKRVTVINTVQVSTSSPDPNSANNTDTEETVITR